MISSSGTQRCARCPPLELLIINKVFFSSLLLILNLSQLVRLLRGHELCPSAQILGYYLLCVNPGNKWSLWNSASSGQNGKDHNQDLFCRLKLSARLYRVSLALSAHHL